MVWDTLKVFAAPGSLALLELGTVVGCAIYYGRPRFRRAARNGLVALYLVYLVLALPCVATAIANRLPAVTTERGASPANGASDARIASLLLFDGDNPKGRIKAAVATYRAASSPEFWLLGDSQTLTIDALIAAGIPRGRITFEPGPGNTREQISRTAEIVASHRGQSVAVVASRLQMPRVIGLARAAGLAIVPIVAPVDDEPPTSGVWRFVPTLGALRVSRDAIYENVALPYYVWRGWIAPI